MTTHVIHGEKKIGLGFAPQKEGEFSPVSSGILDRFLGFLQKMNLAARETAYARRGFYSYKQE
ncbi:hypothetical protein [Candidatus Formimonas warabiya]|uniref:Uncharacterized protein n=1 Tax=Formimonas warabiya TaxID=1761012 RepID=A0A3G1KSR9_FORW1|nr:hypothetical protein [Candidatus Formimonas warabiya]ATW25476.1 hypothetical protein DCMF_12435 [Candidatus Formimonas warabiya]